LRKTSTLCLTFSSVSMLINVCSNSAFMVISSSQIAINIIKESHTPSHRYFTIFDILAQSKYFFQLLQKTYQLLQFLAEKNSCDILNLATLLRRKIGGDTGE